MLIFIYVIVCVCVCMRERERGRARVILKFDGEKWKVTSFINDFYYMKHRISTKLHASVRTCMVVLFSLTSYSFMETKSCIKESGARILVHL